MSTRSLLEHRVLDPGLRWPVELEVEFAEPLDVAGQVGDEEGHVLVGAILCSDLPVASTDRAAFAMAVGWLENLSRLRKFHAVFEIIGGFCWSSVVVPGLVF